jgi:hypothetical protein
MATTTTNFGWDIPQSTDLVKDGATAIAALGQDIDTAMVDLKGGTTGQVLAKASGTDLDFSWVAQDDSNAIQNAIVDAKGDLIAASAADTPARLAVGTNGQVLTADSTAATGLAWATAAATGGMTSIATGSLSGASTNISGISGSYKSLKLVLVGWYASSVDATMSFNSDTSSTYQWAVIKSAANTPSTLGEGATKMYLHQQSGSTSNTTAVAILDVDDYANASYGKVWTLKNYYVASNNSTKVFENQAGFFDSTTAITSIQVTTPGTWSGGTYVLYGVK